MVATGNDGKMYLLQQNGWATIVTLGTAVHLTAVAIELNETLTTKLMH